MSKYSIHIGLPEIGNGCHSVLKNLFQKYGISYNSNVEDDDDTRIINLVNIEEAKNYNDFFISKNFETSLLNSKETCTYQNLKDKLLFYTSKSDCEILVITYNGTGISFKYPNSNSQNISISNEQNANELILLFDNVFWDKDFSENIKTINPNIELLFIFDCCTGGGMGLNLSKQSEISMEIIWEDYSSKSSNKINKKINPNKEVLSFNKNSQDLPISLKNKNLIWTTIGACPQNSFTSPGSNLRKQFINFMNSSKPKKNLYNLINHLIDVRTDLGVITFNVNQTKIKKTINI